MQWRTGANTFVELFLFATARTHSTFSANQLLLRHFNPGVSTLFGISNDCCPRRARYCVWKFLRLKFAYSFAQHCAESHRRYYSAIFRQKLNREENFVLILLGAIIVPPWTRTKKTQNQQLNVLESIEYRENVFVLPNALNFEKLRNFFSYRLPWYLLQSCDPKQSSLSGQ